MLIPDPREFEVIMIYQIEVKREAPTGKVRWHKVTDGRKALSFAERTKAIAYSALIGRSAQPNDYRIVEI